MFGRPRWQSIPSPQPQAKGAILWYLKHTLSIHTLFCLLVKCPNQIHPTFHLALLCSLRGCNLQTMLALVSCLRIQFWKNRISCPSRLRVSSLTSGPVQNVRRPVRYPAVQSSMHPDHRQWGWREKSGRIFTFTSIWHRVFRKLANHYSAIWYEHRANPLVSLSVRFPCPTVRPPQTSPGACHFPETPGGTGQ